MTSELFALSVLLAAPGPAAAQGLDFETANAGWTALGPGVTWDTTSPWRGKSCLALTRGEAQDVWVASEPLTGISPGRPFELSLGVSRRSGTGELAIHLATEPSAPDTVTLWRGATGRDGIWHELRLQIVTGLAAPRLLLGIVGAPATWLVDEVRLSPARLAPVTRPVAKALLPRYCETLPEGWRPEGDLDLRSRILAGVTSYYTQVGPLELSLPREITLTRGERAGLDLEALSRGEAAKTLRLEALGPAGWQTELREIRIVGKGSTLLNIPLQALWCGDADLKLRFTCEGSVAETPLKVHVQQRHPTFGLSWAQGTALPEAGQLRALGAQFHEVSAGGPDARERLAAASAGQADLAVRCGSLDDLETLRGLPDAALSRLATVGLAAPEASSDEQAAFLSSARGLSREAVVASYPFRLRTGAAGLTPPPEMSAALDAGLAKAVDVLAVRLPALPGSAVVREFLDGRATDPIQAASHFGHAWGLWPVRALLREKGAALPIRAVELGGHSTGDCALDALLLARQVVEILSAGANGVALNAQASQPGEVAALSPRGEANQPVLTVLNALERELTGVRSLAPPADTDLAGYWPGKAITYRHFLRADEGIIALWSNTQRPVDVAVEMRLRPRQVRLLRLSYPGELCQREYVSQFEWDAVAKYQHQPAVYVKLQPLQMVIVSLKLRGAHAQWLREVGPKPAGPPAVDPMSREAMDEALWGPE